MYIQNLNFAPQVRLISLAPVIPGLLKMIFTFAYLQTVEFAAYHIVSVTWVRLQWKMKLITLQLFTLIFRQVIFHASNHHLVVDSPMSVAAKWQLQLCHSGSSMKLKCTSLALPALNLKSPTQIPHSPHTHPAPPKKKQKKNWNKALDPCCLSSVFLFNNSKHSCHFLHFVLMKSERKKRKRFGGKTIPTAGSE